MRSFPAPLVALGPQLERPLVETDPLETQHPYGASKAAADLLLKAAAVEFKRTFTILRPFACTGLQDFRREFSPR